MQGVTGSDTLNCPYYGVNGNFQFKSISGCPIVPTEQLGGSGTRCAHWSDLCLQTELMTSYVESGVSSLSKITIGSLQDLGYVVDYSKADAFGKANLNPGCTCKPRSLISLEHGEAHLLGLDDPNTLRRVLSNDAYQAAVNYGRSLMKNKTLPLNVAREDNGVTFVGDKVVSVFVNDGGKFFSVVVKS